MSSIAQWQPSQQAIDSQLSLLEALSTPQLHNHRYDCIKDVRAVSQCAEGDLCMYTYTTTYAQAT